MCPTFNFQIQFPLENTWIPSSISFVGWQLPSETKRYYTTWKGSMVQTPMCWLIIATPYQIATELGSGELAIYGLTMAIYND